MSGLRRHFQGWDRPVLEWALEVLVQGWRGGELDLSDTVMVVPTAESARRLREALALATDKQGGAVTAPHVWPPEVALTWHVDWREVAGGMQERLAWTAVLESADLEAFGRLFPVAPALERRTWAMGVAETLAELRRSTGAGGMAFAEVAKRLAGGEDAERWEELAGLEVKYLEAIGRLELKDVLAVKTAGARAAEVPDGVRRVLVFAVADAPPLVADWLKGVAARVPVEIFVQAPQGEQGGFDGLGAPDAALWGEAGRWLELGEEQLHLEGRPEEQADRAVTLLKNLTAEGMPAALGLGDQTLAPPVAGALAGEGVKAYDPAGRPAGRHALVDLLKAWLKLVESGTWRRLAVFLRQDDVLALMREGFGFSQRGLLEAMDAFYAKRLPATLESAVALSAAPLKDDDAEVMQRLQTLLGVWWRRVQAWREGRGLSALLGELLEWIYGAREFRTEGEVDRDYVELLGEVMRLAGEAERTAHGLGMKMGAAELLRMVLAELEGVALADPRGEVGMVLRGWLELLWEPAPGLVVCGFNDEAVPGRVSVDAFLPDPVRERLGLACQRKRVARDAYVLAALAAQRRGKGALHLVLGRMSEAGDVLRPSRLLFACEDAALPGRVKHLFPKEGAGGDTRTPAHEIAWRLKPARVSGKPDSVSPSLLKSYLRCPTRCYLERILKMERVDAWQREMSMVDFGNLAHEVLLAFGRDAEVRDGLDEGRIRAFFEEALTRLAEARWGRSPLLSSLLQIESAGQRLAHAAKEQARLREEGWRILEVELDLDKTHEVSLGGLPFHARVDRVDVGRDGTLRVLDYKTSHKPRPPLDAHVGSASAALMEDPATAWKCFAGPKGGVRQWTDLQLPLYVWALRRAFPKAAKIEAGYFHLPAAVTETHVEIWPMDDALIDAAVACAEVAAGRMKAGIFWPPTEALRGDRFEELLMGDVLAAVDGSNIGGEAAS